MILPDSSIWIDHLAKANPDLNAFLDADAVLVHPYVIGEVMLGSLQNRSDVRFRLESLPQILPVRHSDVLLMIDQHSLFSSGIGYVDAHLLASSQIRQDCQLWTRDKRLHMAATRLGLALTSG